MQIPCPSCGNLVRSDELVHEVEGPPLCKSCAAIELVRRGPRKSSTSSPRTRSGEGSYIRGFAMGFTCCPALLGLFMPNVGSRTKMGILVGFVVATCVSLAIEAYRKSQGLPSMYAY